MLHSNQFCPQKKAQKNATTTTEIVLKLWTNQDLPSTAYHYSLHQSTWQLTNLAIAANLPNLVLPILLQFTKTSQWRARLRLGNATEPQTPHQLGIRPSGEGREMRDDVLRCRNRHRHPGAHGGQAHGVRLLLLAVHHGQAQPLGAPLPGVAEARHQR